MCRICYIFRLSRLWPKSGETARWNFKIYIAKPYQILHLYTACVITFSKRFWIFDTAVITSCNYFFLEWDVGVSEVKRWKEIYIYCLFYLSIWYKLLHFSELDSQSIFAHFKYLSISAFQLIYLYVCQYTCRSICLLISPSISFKYIIDIFI